MSNEEFRVQSTFWVTVPNPNRNRMNRCFDHEKLEVYQESLLVGLIKANSDYRLHDGD
jgi:hypothetical protein